MPYVALGALFLGLETLAGHVEITYYTLMVERVLRGLALGRPARALRQWRPVLRIAAWLVVMVGLGLALGGVQLIPLYELVRQSFREGSASLQQVRDWAWPSRQILTFLLPDFFGNPTHHSYFDIWQRAWTPVTQNALGKPLNTIDWGVKNYVEGGNYLGIVTLLLAGVGVFAGARGAEEQRIRSEEQGAEEPPLRADPHTSHLRTSVPLYPSPCSPCSRSSSPSARHSMPCSTTVCRATANCIRRSAGCSPTR